MFGADFLRKLLQYSQKQNHSMVLRTCSKIYQTFVCLLFHSFALSTVLGPSNKHHRISSPSWAKVDFPRCVSRPALFKVLALKNKKSLFFRVVLYSQWNSAESTEISHTASAPANAQPLLLLKSVTRVYVCYSWSNYIVISSSSIPYHL